MKPSRLLSLSLFLVSLFLFAACSGGANNAAQNQPPANSTAQKPAAGPTQGGEQTPTAAAPKITLTDNNLKLDAFTGLDHPTHIAVLGPGDLLVTEKTTGRVMHVQNGKVLGPVVELATNWFDERGVLGITLHPQFQQNHYVYVYWTCICKGNEPDSLFGAPSNDPNNVPELGNRLDRFVWDGNKLNYDRNIIKLRSNTLNTDTSGNIRGNHDAGPIMFGPDGKLYMTLGEQNQRGRLQNLANKPEVQQNMLLGVILRLNDDGSVPQDNPFASQGDILGKIFVYGIRNTFGMTFDPKTGLLWETENGDDAYDEINQFNAGDDSGWIQLMGPPDRFNDWKQMELATKDGFDNPEFWPKDLADNAQQALQRMYLLPGARYKPPVLSLKYPNALTAINFIPNDALGADYNGDMLFGDVLSGNLYHFKMSQDRKSLQLTGPLADGVADNKKKGDTTELENNILAKGLGTITDIRPDTDGTIWMVSISNNMLYHLHK